MRRLFTLLLIVTLLACPIALAEENVIDLGFIHWMVDENCMVQIGEKADGQVLAYIFPNFRLEDDFHTHLTVVWHSEEIAIPEDLADFAAMEMENAIQEFAGSVIAISDPQLTDYNANEELPVIMLTYQMGADYSALGVDLVTALYFNQLIYPMEGDGTYSVTVVSDSEFVSMMRALQVATLYAAEHTDMLDWLLEEE